MDGWLSTHVAADGAAKGSFTMGYMEQEDIPFHWALAEKFTLLDNYHCSVMGPTYPNRAVWMSGTNDPQGTGWPDPRDGGAQHADLEVRGRGALRRRLQREDLLRLGVVQLLQVVEELQTTGRHRSTTGTATGRSSATARPAGSATRSARRRRAIGYHGFEEDCANGTLADVTWLFPDGPYASDEHPPNTPAAGAYFLASKLEALAANADLWNSTVFIINYDENDGFFDHVPPPVPDPELAPRGVRHAAVAARDPRWRTARRCRLPRPVPDHLAVDRRRARLLPGRRPHLAAPAHRGDHRGRWALRQRTGHLRRDHAVAPGHLRRPRRRVPGGAAAGPDDAEFDPAARQAANLAAQLTASSLPMPPAPARPRRSRKPLPVREVSTTHPRGRREEASGGPAYLPASTFIK